MKPVDIIREHIIDLGYATSDLINNTYRLLETQNRYEEWVNLDEWLGNNTVFEWLWFWKDRNTLGMAGLYIPKD